MNISQVGINLIKSFEGCRLHAYKAVETEAFFTIGWGHYGVDVRSIDVITQEQADNLFLKDIQIYENHVNDRMNMLGLRFNQNQFDSLVSFTYNCGKGSLVKLCQGRTIEQISESILLYDKSGGKVLNGLVRRRKMEQELFNKLDEKSGGIKMELSKYQWDALETLIQQMLVNKVIVDVTWLSKVKNKTLTLSELAWLGFVTAKR